MLDVDPRSFDQLEDINLAVLRRILGVGHRSGIPQLYSELGVYPLRVRRLELALSYLRYLLKLPESHLARKALAEADRLRCSASTLLGTRSGSCTGVIFPSLLHGRREPFEDKPAEARPLCRRHYLHRIPIPDHRLALTRLLNGSFRFRGVHRPETVIAPDLRQCRKCGSADETPAHVFMQCMDPDTCRAREELRTTLADKFNYDLQLPVADEDARRVMQELIFDWNYVVPMARFIAVVVCNWRWFKNVMPTMVSEDDPGLDDGDMADVFVKLSLRRAVEAVAHEIIALQVIVLLIERPTDDSIEIAVGFMREVGAFLAENSPKANATVFERFRAVLNEGAISQRVQYMIEVLMQVRKDKYKDNPILAEGLDLVEEDEQITHQIQLEEELQKQIKNEILGDSDEESGSEEESSDDEDGGVVENKEGIEDRTETNLVNLRRTIYLSIMNALNYEEAVHKLLKVQLQEGQEIELVNMIIECCSQERSYSTFYGLVSERFSKLNRVWTDCFEQAFNTYYTTIHRYETNRLRNIARLFGHLLSNDAISWLVLECIKINEDDTTSSSRIFVKIMMTELMESMGIKTVAERFKDPEVRHACAGMFPLDVPKNTRFAINYFTSIGLGAVTEEMREYLKNAPKMIMEQRRAMLEAESSSSDSDSSSSDSDSDSDSDSSSSASSRGAPRRRRQSPSPRRRDDHTPPRTRAPLPPGRDMSPPGRSRGRREMSDTPPRRGRDTYSPRRGRDDSPPRRGRDSPPRRGRDDSPPVRRRDSRSPPPPRHRESRSPPIRRRFDSPPPRAGPYLRRSVSPPPRRMPRQLSPGSPPRRRDSRERSPPRRRDSRERDQGYERRR
ncbi:MA3 domain-containing protein [Mycena amicta]|nr:MA3 domain-containing protein [Mycena amicta]